jgi:3-oxoacyl-[acyl-carrier-protein] synthase-3
MPKNAATTVAPTIAAIAAELPGPRWTTEELLAAAGSKLSDQLRQMLMSLGVDTRHSLLTNFPDVLFSGAQPEFESGASELGARAVRQCMEKSELSYDSIGLVLGVTSSPGRLLPSLVCDLFDLIPEIPRTTPCLSVTYMGCSAIAKVVETATWYLTVNPGKNVLVCFMDAITPLSPPLPGTYVHFSEITPERRQETVDAMHGFLFGDAAVAMVLSAEGAGPTFGPVAGLTNEQPGDAELGTVPDGGSDIPEVFGRRLYTLSPDVSARGVAYASSTVKSILANGDCGVDSAADASMLLMHTGSQRILDALCAAFDVPRDGDVVASSYRVLRDYGNTIGCSVPLMLAEPVHRPAGEGIVMAFGLSFSCGAFSMTVPTGGWHP